jgi:hypothetical protein
MGVVVTEVNLNIDPINIRTIARDTGLAYLLRQPNFSADTLSRDPDRNTVLGASDIFNVLDTAEHRKAIDNKTNLLVIVKSGDQSLSTHINLLYSHYIDIMHPNGAKVKPFQL